MKIISAALGHAVLRSTATVVLWLLGGGLGVAFSFVWMWTVGRRSILEAYEAETRAAHNLATSIHLLICILVVGRLGVAPPWL